MSEPVTPISGAYPPPAVIVRNAHAPQRPAAPEPVVPTNGAAAARMAGGQGVALAGAGWASVLHTAQRRGLRADETERRRYRASYAQAGGIAPQPAPRMERRA